MQSTGCDADVALAESTAADASARDRFSGRRFSRFLVLFALGAGFVLVYGWVYQRATEKIVPMLSDIDGNTQGDFGHFYHAAVAIRKHEALHSSWKHGYIYPPLLAFVMMPLTGLSSISAAHAFVGFNVLLSIGLSLLAAREAARRLGLRPAFLLIASAALLATVLLVDKIRGEIRMGQTNVLMLATFVLGL